MTKQIVVVGAGGFGREVLDVVDALNGEGTDQRFDVLGVVDDTPTSENLAHLRDRDIQFLGGIAEMLEHHAPSGYVVGIGSPMARGKVAVLFEAAGWRAVTLVHPSATHGFGVEIGEGSVICAGVRVTTNIRLGIHVHLNLNVTVGHDTTVGDFVSVNPLASISGDCTIEDGVLIGVAGVLLNGVTVGAHATVGGSACVVREVPAGATVKGVPAR